MSTIEYPYARAYGKLSPIIPIGIGNNNLWQRIEVYVDSGAFYSVIKSDFAEIIGIDFRKGRKVYVQVGDGGYIPVHLHTIDIQIKQHRLSAEIGFSHKLGVKFNILGRKSIFENFEVCFDDHKGIVRLTPFFSLGKK